VLHSTAPWSVSYSSFSALHLLSILLLPISAQIILLLFSENNCARESAASDSTLNQGSSRVQPDKFKQLGSSCLMECGCSRFPIFASRNTTTLTLTSWDLELLNLMFPRMILRYSKCTWATRSMATRRLHQGASFPSSTYIYIVHWAQSSSAFWSASSFAILGIDSSVTQERKTKEQHWHHHRHPVLVMSFFNLFAYSLGQGGNGG
jgi:hypothetical protein